jgi:hypothetical protein
VKCSGTDKACTDPVAPGVGVNIKNTEISCGFLQTVFYSCDRTWHSEGSESDFLTDNLAVIHSLRAV